MCLPSTSVRKPGRQPPNAHRRRTGDALACVWSLARLANSDARDVSEALPYPALPALAARRCMHRQSMNGGCCSERRRESTEPRARPARWDRLTGLDRPRQRGWLLLCAQHYSDRILLSPTDLASTYIGNRTKKKKSRIWAGLHRLGERAGV